MARFIDQHMRSSAASLMPEPESRRVVRRLVVAEETYFAEYGTYT